MYTRTNSYEFDGNAALNAYVINNVVAYGPQTAKTSQNAAFRLIDGGQHTSKAARQHKTYVHTMPNRPVLNAAQILSTQIAVFGVAALFLIACFVLY